MRTTYVKHSSGSDVRIPLSVSSIPSVNGQLGGGFALSTSSLNSGSFVYNLPSSSGLHSIVSTCTGGCPVPSCPGRTVVGSSPVACHCIGVGVGEVVLAAEALVSLSQSPPASPILNGYVRGRFLPFVDVRVVSSQ